MVKVFSTSPDICTAPARTSMVRIEYTIMLVILNSLTKMEAWIEHNAKLFDVAFEWPSDEFLMSLPLLSPPSVSATLIRKAHSKVTCGSDACSFCIIIEMLKAAGEEGVELARRSMASFQWQWNPSRLGGVLNPEPRQGEGEAYCCLKPTDLVMRLMEWVLHFYIHKIMDID